VHTSQGTVIFFLKPFHTVLVICPLSLQMLHFTIPLLQWVHGILT